MRLTRDTLALRVTDTTRLRATATAADGTPLDATITWSSSNPAVASVDAAGLVTARDSGAAEIRATAGSVGATAALMVLLPAQESVAVSATDTTVAAVGYGTAILIPPGTLAAGTTVKLQEVPTFDSSTAVLGTTAFEISLSDTTPGSAPPGVALLRLSLPIDTADLARAGGSLVVKVGPRGAGLTGLPWVSAPTTIAVTRDAFGRPRTTALVRVPLTSPVSASAAAAVAPGGAVREASPSASGASLVIAPAMAARTCAYADVGKRFYHPDPPRSATLTPAGRVPLVLIGGWQPTILSCNTSPWDWYDQFDRYWPELSTWSGLLATLGQDATIADYDVWIYRYPTFQSITASADDFAAVVEQYLPNRDIVIVAHSMGGLVAVRYMLAHPDNRVARLLTLGTPFLGTPLADPNLAFRVRATTEARTVTELVALGLTATDGGKDLSDVGAFITSPGGIAAGLRGSNADELHDQITAVGGAITATLTSLGTARDILVDLGWFDNDGVVATGSAANRNDGSAFGCGGAVAGAQPCFGGMTYGGYDHSMLTNVPGLSSRLRAELQGPASVALPSFETIALNASQALALDARTLLGQPAKLNAALPPHVVWGSDDSNIVQVDQSGLAHAVGVGTTNVWARVALSRAVTRVTVPAPSTATLILSASGFPPDPPDTAFGGTAVLTGSIVNDTVRFLLNGVADSIRDVPADTYSLRWLPFVAASYNGRRETWTVSPDIRGLTLTAGSTTSAVGNYALASASVIFATSGFPAYLGAPSPGDGTFVAPGGSSTDVTTGTVFQNLLAGGYTMTWKGVGPFLMCGRSVRMRPDTALVAVTLFPSLTDTVLSMHYSPARGILQLAATGFPDNSPAAPPTFSGTVTGPNGFSASVPYNVYDDLPPGTYTVTWAPSTFQYNGQTVTYRAAPTTIDVPASALVNGCPTAVTATASYAP